MRPLGVAISANFSFICDSAIAIPICLVVHPNSREQYLVRLRILHADSADRTVLRCLQDLLNAVTCRIDDLRLTILVEAKHRSCDGLAHGVADTDLRIDPDAQFTGHWLPPNAR